MRATPISLFLIIACQLNGLPSMAKGDDAFVSARGQLLRAEFESVEGSYRKHHGSMSQPAQWQTLMCLNEIYRARPEAALPYAKAAASAAPGDSRIQAIAAMSFHLGGKNVEAAQYIRNLKKTGKPDALVECISQAIAPKAAGTISDILAIKKDNQHLISTAHCDFDCLALLGADESVFKLEFAKQACDELVKCHPNSPLAYFRRGIYDIGARESSNAIADFTAALNLNPQCVAAYEWRAKALGIQGKLQPAIADWSKVIAARPDDVAAYQGRAKCYSWSRDHKSALLDYRHGLSILRNRSLQGKGQPSTMDNQRAECWSEVASELAQMNRIDEAVREINKVSNAYPNYESVQSNKISILAMKANSLRDLKQIQFDLKQNPLQAQLYRKYSDFLLRIGDADGARQQKQIAEHLEKTGRLPAALKLPENSLELPPR